MGFALLGLSALALAGAVVLLRADSAEKPDKPTEPAEPTPAEPGPTPQPPAEPEYPAEQALEPEPEPKREPKSKGWRFPALALPGATKTNKPHKVSRKARREWATANGFTYAAEDEFLHDEWTCGAAATGAPVKDVLTGTKFGHETRIADIAGTTVIGMGTGMGSDVVVDMRRVPHTTGPSEDLVEVSHKEGFAVFASDAGAAERMLDIRVETALEMLPAQVSTVWFESEWVLAELAEPAEWEEVFAPLALLADAARTLPPASWPRLDLAAGVPSREMGEPLLFDDSSQPSPDHPAHPPVARPEEPLEMPTRTTGGVRGMIAEDNHELGSDEVSAIATGQDQPQSNDGTRVTRQQQPPSIFGD